MTPLARILQQCSKIRRRPSRLSPQGGCMQNGSPVLRFGDSVWLMSVGAAMVAPEQGFRVIARRSPCE